jgi:hypothetical protein
LKRRATPIGANDLWIACHALAIGATVVSHNVSAFSPALMGCSWWTEPTESVDGALAGGGGGDGGSGVGGSGVWDAVVRDAVVWEGAT